MPTNWRSASDSGSRGALSRLHRLLAVGQSIAGSPQRSAGIAAVIVEFCERGGRCRLGRLGIGVSLELRNLGRVGLFLFEDRGDVGDRPRGRSKDSRRNLAASLETASFATGAAGGASSPPPSPSPSERSRAPPAPALARQASRSPARPARACTPERSACPPIPGRKRRSARSWRHARRRGHRVPGRPGLRSGKRPAIHVRARRRRVSPLIQTWPASRRLDRGS